MTYELTLTILAGGRLLDPLEADLHSVCDDVRIDYSKQVAELHFSKEGAVHVSPPA